MQQITHFEVFLHVLNYLGIPFSFMLYFLQYSTRHILVIDIDLCSGNIENKSFTKGPLYDLKGTELNLDTLPFYPFHLCYI